MAARDGNFGTTTVLPKSGKGMGSNESEGEELIASKSRKRKLSVNTSTGIQDKRARLQALVDDRSKRGLTAPPSVQQSKRNDSGDVGDPKPSSSRSASMHPDLTLSKQLAFDAAGLNFTKPPAKDKECEEYAGYEFSLNNHVVKFRVAKTTPTKNGNFVTFWKRIGKGRSRTYDAKDNIDFFVVCVKDGEKFGQFVFPKKAFQTEGVISVGGKGGKRAIRVYAPWVKPESTQASNTQAWQSKYFVKLRDKAFQPDVHRIKRLYGVGQSA